jgi:hypothetical protein
MGARAARLLRPRGSLKSGGENKAPEISHEDAGPERQPDRGMRARRI